MFSKLARFNLFQRFPRLIHWILGLIAFLSVVILPFAHQVTVAHTYQTRYIQTAQAALAERSTLLGKTVGNLEIYSLSMSGNAIIPNPVSTGATAEAGAVLEGNTLIVRGGFRGLSGQLRDYATDPLDPPNPNITSAVHIHRGKTTENGPFQYALTVTLADDKVSGTFAGEFTLTEEQLQALKNGMLYMDIHTKTKRGGELRGFFKA